MELRSLADFGAAARAGRAIVIADNANGVKAHQPDCPFVTEKNFTKKVLIGHGKNGSYFAVRDIDEAVRRHRATRCLRCKP